MTINGKVGSFGYEGERAHTSDHPPVFKGGPVKADNGSYPAGLVLAVDGNGDLVPCEDLATETIAGINDAPVDTTQEDVAVYVAHGTVKRDMLAKGAAAAALTAADLAKLEALGVYAV